MMQLFRIVSFLFFAIIGFSYQSIAQAQLKPATADTGKTKQIEIVQAQRLNFEKTDSADEYNSLAGNVIVVQGRTTFYCDSAILNKKLNTLQAFGKVHINDADSVHIYSDYGRYEGNTKKAYLRNNVKLTDGKGTLTTSELDYDVNTKIGTYNKGGTVVNGKTVLTSKEGIYYGDTRDIYFSKNVSLKDPEYTLKSDSLLYNSLTEIATFITRTDIKSKEQRVITSEGYYDLRNKKAYFGKRPTIYDGSTILIADKVANDDASGFGEANGNVIMRDTAQGFVMYAGNVKTNRKINSVLATNAPVMGFKQDEDSIFIAADTLYSSTLTHLRQFRTVPKIRDSIVINKKDSNANRFFEAYYHVRIFSDSMQAVCDSLFYSGEDSVFRLFKNPVLWSQGNQLTGDTIYLYSRHRKPERIYVFENGLTISKVNDKDDFFNQVKGRVINGYFKDGNIDFLRAKGNAETIYYGEDDFKKLINVTQSSADAIEVNFLKRQPDKVVLLRGVKGVSYPMRQVNHAELRVRGFRWLEDIRPKSKFALLKKS